MRRGRIFIYLALILLLALAGVFLYLRQRTGSEEAAEATPAPALVEIVVAEQNIPQGAIITDDVLGKISLPEGTDFSVMIRYDEREEKIIGKIARYRIERGVVVTTPMIGGSVEDIALKGPEWVSLIPSGMTAIAVPTSRLSSVAYGVGDGARLNVIACFLFVDIDSGFQSVLPNRTAFVSAPGFIPSEAPSLSASVSAGATTIEAGSAQGRVELDPTFQQPVYIVPSESQRPRPVCQMILQDVVVMKLGDFATTESAAIDMDEEGVPTEETGELPPDVVTLMVPPQDAVSLTYLMYGGAKLTLTLRRGEDDKSRVETEAATLQYVLSQYAIPVPAKLPYATEPRFDALIEPTMGNDADMYSQ